MLSGFQLAQQQAAAYESFTSVFMGGSARLLAEGARIGAGDVVLDLACGTGLVARHVASLVGRNGRLVGVDINPAMLEIARASSAYTNVEWVEAPCDALPFDEATFTHIICQQAFQFFPEPVDAMREAIRVLRPGGKMLATVWATPGHNPYIENQLDLLAQLDPSVTSSVQRATPAHADDFLRSTALSAGFDHVTVTLLEHDAEIVDFEPWFLAQTASTPWGPTIAALTTPQRDALASAMKARIEPYAMPAGGYRIPFRSYRLEAHAPTKSTDLL